MLHSVTVAYWALHYHQDQPFPELRASFIAKEFYHLLTLTLLVPMISTIPYFHRHFARPFLCFGLNATQSQLFL